MTHDDEVPVDTAAGPVRVHRGSLIASALDPARTDAERQAQLALGRMQWSLGSELADLLWMVVPEARAALAALASKALADAAEYGRFLSAPLYGDVTSVVYDVLRTALAEQQADVVQRTLAVLRRVIVEVDGDFRWGFIHDYVIRMLESDGHGQALEELDPEFAELVRATRRRLGQD
ncbi:hypothetical protein [Kribbella sp. NPDC051718]|uniref:hypothetical protein n=1 Tax=Kribbella sp. NPDC051718 TaxID=3155168 RepID=UPI00343B7000